MKRLLIDIPALMAENGKVKDIQCEYLYHRKNAGFFDLLEVAEFASYCRQCKDAFCVAACPKEALERQESGTIKRYNMRCVGCKSCILACPFGTIFPEVINYVTTKCDFCLNQLKEDPDYTPLCVKTAPSGTFQMVEIDEKPEEFIFYAGEHLAVKSPSWLQKEGKR
ncbi:4Fe-4S dicluster domain-containing protein [candidate division KSB1 bacterium]|nr:4Fe-4S dicluster domain-containing protein [candidate division KSB1 bacterium]RQW02070.1 MAG: 4Fe-4S dicluster domain-containing protein [candidate division KSB1 bacterium]